MWKLKSRILTFFVVIAIFLLGIYVNTKSEGEVAGLKTDGKSNVHGLVLPHHDLAREIILTSYDRIKENNYSYIVVFGPNHFYPDKGSVVTSRYADNSFDNEVVNKLILRFPDILEDKDIVQKEHSIMIQIPHIKYTFGEIPIVPFIISPYAGLTEITEKLEFLLTILPSDTLFIASVDFSHNNMVEKALVNNAESINSISNFDYKKIMIYDDNYMDSPQSIALLLKSMEARGFKTWETWDSTHGSIIENDPKLRGTSYVTGVFK